MRVKNFPLDIPALKTSSASCRNWLWIALTVGVVLLLSLPDIFFGVELGDTGFYMTFYENFFSAPESVEYNYMYWFSGLVGKGWLAIWPGGGLVWMRFGGALCLVGIALAMRYCCVSLLGGRNSESVALGAVVLVVGGYFRGVHVLGYDLVTCLLGIWGAVLTARALMKGKSLLPGAFLLGINVFTRLTNLCEVMILVIVPLAYRFMTAGKYPSRLALRRSLEWFAGWLAGIAFVVVLIFSFGQWELMMSNIHDLAGIASGATGETTHNLEYLQLKSMKLWGSIVKRTLILLCFMLPAMFASRKMKEGKRKRQIVTILYLGGLVCWLLLSLLRQDGSTLLATASLALAGCSCALIQRRYSRGAALAWSAVFLMRLLPMGCDGILLGVGTTALALAVAVAGWWVASAFRRGRWALWGVALLFTGVCGARMFAGGAYMDDGPLTEKTAVPNVAGLEGAYTTPQRAAALEEIVADLNQSVRPGERIVIYGGAPGLYWLTGTQPAFGNSWPEQLSASQLMVKMDGMAAEGDYPPVIFHEFDAQTYGDFTPDPTYGLGGGEETPYHVAEKNKQLHDWLLRNGYRLERRSRWFSVYTKID